MKEQSRHSASENSEGTVTLWIDSYNDIFSDFDPRPFSDRAISDDFVTQVKRVSRERSDNISMLKLLVPEGTQKEEHEKIIKKRLQSYFYNMCSQVREELTKLRKKGFVFILSGVLLMIIATYISFLELSAFYFKLVLALFEPGGWFLLWTGLDFVVTSTGSKKTENSFYRKMENVHVEFSLYH